MKVSKLSSLSCIYWFHILPQNFPVSVCLRLIVLLLSFWLAQLSEVVVSALVRSVRKYA